MPRKIIRHLGCLLTLLPRPPLVLQTNNKILYYIPYDITVWCVVLIVLAAVKGAVEIPGIQPLPRSIY